MNVDLIVRLADVAREQPLATAVVAAGREYTYGDLDRRSHALADRLAAEGVVPGEPVGVLCARGVDWIAALWAILRVGAVYVPLNPELPVARLREQAELIGLRRLVRSAGQPDLDARYASIDAASSAPAAATPVLHPSRAAYVIFTSGTSGRPKPVEIGYANLCAHVEAARARYALTSRDRLLQICATSFDISIEEVLPGLAAGATLVIAETAAAHDLRALLATQAITLANLPTALWCALVDELDRGGARLPQSLTRLVVGGEACPVAKVRVWCGLPDAARVECLNGYGPSETTITATVWRMTALPADQAHAPVGEPIAGVECRVLDAALTPVDAGQAGELYIGGALVGGGYRGNPAATAAAFVPDPFSTQPGARLYRSGDRAWRDTNGQIVIGGRLDRQLKIRGYRVEPAEIEMRLVESGLARHAVVELAPGAARPLLVAYVVARDDTTVETASFHRADAAAVAPLVAALAAVPDYMRPERYCFLAALPLTANGKVDLAALPAPPRDASADGDGLPCDFVDALVAALGYVPPADGGFHAAGGDSIQAVRVLGFLRERGWRLALADLVGTTLRDAASALERLPAAASAAPAAGFWAGLALADADRARLAASVPDWRDVEQVCAVSVAQLGMLWRSLERRREGQYVEQVEGELVDLDLAAFRDAWDRVIARHAILRGAFALSLRERPVLLVRRRVEPEWHLLDWTAGADGRLERLLADDRRRSFDLVAAPLMRFHVARLDARRVHFVWTYHHALLDGWSDVAVLDEVFALYAARGRDTDDVLAPAAAYADYVGWLHSRDTAAARRFWRAHLDGLRGRGWFLADMSREPSPGVARRAHRYDAVRTAALCAAARRCGATLTTLVIAAWTLALARRRGTADAVIGMIVSTRSAELPALERTFGPLINLLPLRVRRPRGDATPAQWVAELQSVLVERQTHAFYDIESTAPDKNDGLFDTLFVIDNYPPPAAVDAASLRSHMRCEYPLCVLVSSADALAVELQFDPALVDGGVLDRFWPEVEDALAQIERGAFADAAPEAGAAPHDDALLELSL